MFVGEPEELDFGERKGKLKAIKHQVLELILALLWGEDDEGLIGRSFFFLFFPLNFQFVAKVGWDLSLELAPWSCEAFSGFSRENRVVIMAQLTSLVSQWLLLLVLPTDMDMPWWDGPGDPSHQGWRFGNVGWAGMCTGTCRDVPLLLAAPWLPLQGPGSISSPAGAWCHPALPLISPNSWQPGVFPH